MKLNSFPILFLSRTYGFKFLIGFAYMYICIVYCWDYFKPFVPTGDEEKGKVWVDECTDTKCPVECVCDGTSVDCSNRGLREVPQDLPEQMTRL